MPVDLSRIDVHQQGVASVVGRNQPADRIGFDIELIAQIFVSRIENIREVSRFEHTEIDKLFAVLVDKIIPHFPAIAVNVSALRGDMADIGLILIDKFSHVASGEAVADGRVISLHVIESDVVVDKKHSTDPFSVIEPGAAERSLVAARHLQRKDLALVNRPLVEDGFRRGFAAPGQT